MDKRNPIQEFKPSSPFDKEKRNKTTQDYLKKYKSQENYPIRPEKVKSKGKRMMNSPELRSKYNLKPLDSKKLFHEESIREINSMENGKYQYTYIHINSIYLLTLK